MALQLALRGAPVQNLWDLELVWGRQNLWDLELVWGRTLAGSSKGPACSLKKSQDELVPQKSCGAGYEQVPEGRISSHLKKGNYGAGYELVPGGRISSCSSQIYLVPPPTQIW